MPACSSCGAAIEWGTMRESSSPMPYDPEEFAPNEVRAQMVAVRRRDRLAVVLNEPAAMKVRASVGSWAGWSFHASHWESCPSSEKHRVNPNQETML